jgi:DNA ligase (NAD+)
MDSSKLAALLAEANEAYRNSGSPIMTDAEYDALKEELEAMDPHHPFLSQVGAVAASGRKTVLPYWMGSLDKVKPGKVEKKTQGFQGAVISEKLDGVSALLVGGSSLYTRGDGRVGQDVTHLLRHLPNIPRCGEIEQAAVRGELVIPRAAFEQHLRQRGANARNLVSGIVNAKEPDMEVLKHVRFVPYATLSSMQDPPSVQKRDLVSRLGFGEIVEFRVVPGFDEDLLTSYLAQRKRESLYEIDGLVVESDVPGVYDTPGKNPSKAFAFKDASLGEHAVVTVDRVEWKASKDGLLKPTVHFEEAVRLSGASIKRATGFHAQFVQSNRIGKGAKVFVTRSGDVIPHIGKVLLPAEAADMPTGGDYEWTASGKDLRVSSSGDQGDVQKRLLECFFERMNVPGMGPGTVKKLHAAGFDTVGKIKRGEFPDSVLGPAVSAKARQNLARLSEPQDCIDLMEASNAFGRGMGKKKLGAILDAFPQIPARPSFRPETAALLEVEGVKGKTAEAFLQGLARFWDFVKANELQVI